MRTDKMSLEIQKLRHETAIEALHEQASIMELAKLTDLEADRLAKPGSRGYRQLDVTSIIAGGNVDIWINQLEHWERRDPAKPIVIRINSPGGGVLDGFALFDTILRLRRKGHRVTTHGLGMVASLATILMQAGDERVLDANAWFMIHEISTKIQGNTSEVMDAVKFQNKLEDRLLNILAERSTLSVGQISRRWKRTDDWMSAQEAKKFGFIDRVE